MEASPAVHGLRGSICLCERSVTLCVASVDFLRQQRVGSNSLAGSRWQPPSCSKKAEGRRLPARCRYSPLVESFEASRIRPFTSNTGGNAKDSLLVSSNSFALLKPLDTSTEKAIASQKSSPRNYQYVSRQDSVEEKNVPAPEDPVAAAHGDSSSSVATSASGPDLDVRRPERYHPQTMSLTQGFRSAGNRGVSYVIGAAGRPAANASKLGGPAGLIMGLAVAGVGIATALQKAVEVQPLPKLCTRCEGYGVERCDVCNGTGKVTWEGKALRTHICPRCFGSLLKKCPRCDGYCAKKESLSTLQKLKTPPKK